MALKRTRKRLKEYEDLLRYQTASKEEHDSLLSKFGVNPLSILSGDKKAKVKIIKKSNEKDKYTENYIEKTKLKKAKEDAYSIKIDPNEKDIRKKIIFSKNKENINLDEINIFKNKPKERRKMILLMAIVELITLVAVVGVGMLVRISNSTQSVPFDAEKVINKEIDSETLKKMQGYRTIAIFGLDSRTGSVSKGNNADVNIIANINYDNGEVKLVSIYRDLYLNVSDSNRYGKFNSAYFYGGPEGAVKSLNKNLDLNITNYVSFNWKAVADGISMLGGIDLEIKKSEYKFMNSFIHETCIATGINADNPAANYISGSGMQHLNGVQAVAYARLRLMDSDFQRVERQKKVIALCLEKAKTLDFNTIMGIAISIIPTISYDFDWSELTSLVKSIDGIHIVESAGFPSNKYFTNMKMGSNGDCVIPYPLNKAVVELHQLLYDNNEYTPSKAVNGYSGRIIELKEQFAEENRIEASRIAKEKEEEEKRKTTPNISTRSIIGTKRVTKKTTSSNITKKLNPFNEEVEKIIVPIVPKEYDDYEEEPEEDGIVIDPFAPKTDEKKIEPKSQDDMVVAPPSSIEEYDDKDAPYNSQSRDDDAPYNNTTRDDVSYNNSRSVEKNNIKISPMNDESDTPNIVTTPPWVSATEKETTVSKPISAPPIPISGGAGTPPISGMPSGGLNTGPPMG